MGYSHVVRHFLSDIRSGRLNDNFEIFMVIFVTIIIIITIDIIIIINIIHVRLIKCNLFD